jgi:glycosyltransferase involved in cell wall biosynthesis
MMRPMLLRTSVIIPVRNGANFISEAIASVQPELGASDEIIVVDDLSQDNTRAIVSAFPDTRLRIVEGPGRGVSAARNAGLASAKGDLVAFLDHDDIWPRGRHAVLLQALADQPQVDAVFGRVYVKYEPGARVSARFAAIDGTHVPRILVGSGLFRRHVIEKVGGFSEQMHFGEDVDFSLRLEEAGLRIALCDVSALIYRRHTTNSTERADQIVDSMLDVISRRIARRRGRVHGGV